MTGWANAIGLMRANGGLALRAEVRELGVPERTLFRRLQDGSAIEVNPWVIALPGTQLDLAALTRAAVLARPAAIPAGLSAAVVLGEGPWDEVPQVGAPWLVGDRERALDARVFQHPGIKTVKRAGLVLSHPAYAVVDLLRFLDPQGAAAVGRAAVQRRTVTLDFLAERRAALGRLAGARQLGLVIEQLHEGTHAESEHRFVALLREAGIGGWRANHPVRIGTRRYFLDVAFAEARLAVEIDGRAHHSSAAAFQNDRRRQNDLVAAGWTVLRFTWGDIVDRPHEVIARILTALESPALARWM